MAKKLKKIPKKKLKKIPKKKLKKIPKKKFITPEPLPLETKVPIMAKGELLMGNYCNIASVNHTEREFVLDFFFKIVEQSSLVSRVITSPQHIKKIYEVLGTNIEKYENKFGEIKV